ncbi:MAG: efflux RND transporter permease subunit [Parachlamydiales bacterium]|nr:efflux RND transporter permease subunit [Parachlamydiales bacterium]
MNISSPFIKRPIMTTLVMLGFVFFGFFAYKLLPVSDLPSVDYPTITVKAANPGSNAQTMAATVATPLEKQFMTIPGIFSVISTSTSGQTQISLTFDLDKDINAAATDVSAAITQASGYLPTTMPTQPTYQKFNPSDSPIIFMGISSETMSMGELYNWANTVVAQRLSILSGVSNVTVYGSKQAVRIKLNPDIISSMNLGIDTVAQSIVDATQNLPGGQVYNKSSNLTLEPDGQLEKAKQYQEVIVAYQNESPVKVKDIGRAYDSTEEENLYINYWNSSQGTKPTIMIAVTKQGGSNTVAVCKAIKDLVPELEKQLPPSASLDVVYDTSERIKLSLIDVEETLLIAFILVVIVIFLFLGKISATIIPSIALPITIIGTCIFMYYFNYSIDTLSAMAITLVIGFLVDDAIVVLENIVRHLEMGKTPLQAALDGSKQISMTVLSMTLSLVAVFIPLIFMPGIIGKIFHEFAIVVAIAVLFSGFISLTLTPMLCSKFLKAENKKTRLERFAHGFFQSQLKIYTPLLKGALRFKFIPILIAATACAAAVFLFIITPQDFLPPGDTGVIQGFTLAEEGVGPEAMARYQAEVTDLIKTNPNVDKIISVTNTSAGQNNGFIFAMLKNTNLREPISKVLGEIYGSFTSLMGVQCFLRSYPEINLDVGTSHGRADYTFSLSTVEDAEQLYDYTQQLTNKLMTIPELTDVSSDVQNNNPQINIDILRNQASSYGISVQAIERALYLGYGEGQLTTFSTPIDTYKIIIQMENRYKKDIQSLDKLYLTSKTTQQLVPLRSVAKWDLGIGPLSVQHINQFTSSSIYFNIKPNVALGPVLAQIEQISNEILPLSIMRQFQGQAQVFQGTSKSLLSLVIIGIAVIYLLLGILYESFIHPLTILSALPGAVFGALMTLFIFNQSLSLYAYVGIIVLIGIVMKNGIMLVEFANEQVRAGKPALDAIIEAARERFRPILMTTIAAAVGAVPIALGFGTNYSRRSLGMVIIGGLVFAQLITLFFTPVLYLLFENAQTRSKTRKLRKANNGESTDRIDHSL